MRPFINTTKSKKKSPKSQAVKPSKAKSTSAKSTPARSAKSSIPATPKSKAHPNWSLSDEGRKKIAAAQLKRWKAYRASKKAA